MMVVGFGDAVLCDAGLAVGGAGGGDGGGGAIFLCIVARDGVLNAVFGDAAAGLCAHCGAKAYEY